MGFLKDIQDKIILGRWRFLNLKSLSGTTKQLGIDDNGVLGLVESGETSVSWDDIQDKPSTYPPTIGVTADTAKAGNYQPTWSQVTGKPTTFTPTIGNTATTALAGDTVIPSPSTTTPLANGTATAGTSTSYARQDHVHPLQTSVSGNAGTATTLATGRTFTLTGGATGASAAFNGSANATISVTLATPTATVRGGVLGQVGIPDLPSNATLTEVVDSYNELLFIIRASGVILP